MNLASIKIIPYTKKPESPLKALVTAAFTNSLVLQGMRLIESRTNPGTLNLLYPVVRTGEETKGIYFPATKEGKAFFKEMVMSVYNEMPDKASKYTKTFDTTGELAPLVLGRVQVYPHRETDGKSLAKVHVTVENDMSLRFMQLMKNQQDGTLYLSIPRYEASEEFRIPYYKFMDATVRDALLAQILPSYEEAQQQLKRNRRNRRYNVEPLTSRPFASLQQ